MRIARRSFALSLAFACASAQAISVEEFFSVQEQASVQNVSQVEARTSLNGVYAGLRDGLFAAVYFGGGTLYYEGQPFVCVEDTNQLTKGVVREALADVIGTFENPKLSPSGAAAMPLGMHALIGLSRRYPCSE